MTEAQEKFVFDCFKGLYKNLPLGNIEHLSKDSHPDFILTLPHGSEIAVELTEIVKSEESRRDYSTRNKITDLVLAKLATLLPFKFSLSISLLPIGVSKNKEKETVDEIVQVCIKEFYFLNDGEIIELWNLEANLDEFPPDVLKIILDQQLRNLPVGISSICIGRYDDAPEAWNPYSGGMIVSNFMMSDLVCILKRKEPKIDKYPSSKEYWLVIWEGNIPEGCFNKIEIESPIESKFDKVFITRTGRNELVILKP